MFSLLKNYIIFDEVIISVNMSMIEEISNEKLFYLTPSGGACYLSKRAAGYNFEFVLQTF